MKRYILTIFLSAAVLILISAYERKPSETLYTPHNTIIENGDSCLFDMSRMNGQNVLLTFWSSDDAESRLSNMYYASLARKHDDMVHIGVNFDSSPEMFRELLRRDNLENDSLQFQVLGDDAAKLLNRYGLRKGYQSYLFDKSGKVIARNPSVEKVSRLIGATGS